MTEKEQRVRPSTGVEGLEAMSGLHVFHSVSRIRMTSAPQADSAEFPDELWDDTIELALTEEEMLALSRAAEEEHAETSPDKSALIATSALLRNQSVRSRGWPLLLASSVLVIVIGTVIGVVWGLVADRSSPATLRVHSAATRSAKSLDSPVRFSNPFDPSEVFEFPHGTSDEQVRQSVEAILRQRARDRHGVGVVNGNQLTPGAAFDPARIARDSETKQELLITP